MAGTVLRRWNGNGGGRRWGPDVQSTSVAVSLQDVSGVHPGETDSGGFLLESCVAGGMETDSCGAQFVFPVVETESGGAQIEYPAAETDAGGVLWDAGPSRYDPKCGQREGAEVLPISGDAPRICSSGGAEAGQHDVLGMAVGSAAGHPCSSGFAGAGRHDVLGTAVGCATGRAVGLGRRATRLQVRMERTEAGSLDSFGNDAFLSCRIESPSSRVARVTSALHNLCPDHSALIPAHNSHGRMPHSRCVVNSVGDTEDGGRLSCVFWGIKSLSTSTRTGVRRSAVCGSAHAQQTPLKLHVETWAGLLRNQGPKISRRWKSYRGVLSLWPVLHVLIILLSHLGQAE